MKKIAIIGGGAAGLFCAVRLSDKSKYSVTLFERNDRLGKKLSATGNGQGNVTNTDMGGMHYFSDDREKVEKLLGKFGSADTVAFLSSMGGVFLPDSRGRVYPAGRQASAVTDLFRKQLNCEVRLSAFVSDLSRRGKGFELVCGEKREYFDLVVLTTGGMAAPNFGTDGNGYALAKKFGHTVTECFPALVQLKTDAQEVRGLKGIRVDGEITAFRGQKKLTSVRGDVLFTDGGISGDAAFKISSWVKAGDTLSVDLLPNASEEELFSALSKRAGEDCLLCVVNNGLGRVLFKRAGGDKKKLLSLIKAFPLTVRGTLGYAYAQVTKGGIPLKETDEQLQSKKAPGLYFAGEILNCDGECGGYNLQWAFTSANAVAEGIASC